MGLLNRAAPRSGPLVVDDDDLREVLETLDDDFAGAEVVKGADLAEEFGVGDDVAEENVEEEGEEELDGILADIVAGGNEQEVFSDEEEGSFDSNFGGDYDDDDFDDDELETKTKFTNYSMSSSVIPRSEHLTTLDDRFEKVRFVFVFSVLQLD